MNHIMLYYDDDDYDLCVYFSPDFQSIKQFGLLKRKLESGNC